METMTLRRIGMSAMGAAAGVAGYGLVRLADADLLSGRPLMAAVAFALTFFTALMGMEGPLRGLRAAFGAALMAVVVAGLLLLASLRFDPAEGVFDTPMVVLACIILALVPMPFWIARNGPGLRHYPTLFGESWAIVVRYMVAWLFVGAFWAVIVLSDGLLQLVGLRILDQVLTVGAVPWILTGGVLGLGLAVVQDLSDYISPFLILRLLRLLLPVILGVTAVFLVLLPMRGISGLFEGLSVAATLLAMAAATATLVTTAVDQTDAEATQTAILTQSARGLCLLLPVIAALGAWAVWLRVDQYGWTPERIFAAEVAVLALGYGVLYIIAVLRGSGWMARIRQANIVMAAALLVMAALSLTPLLNAQAISAGSVQTRLADGRMPVDALEPALLERWGLAGAALLSDLRDRAKEPGQEALAARLEGREDDKDILAQVKDLLPLQPADAVTLRDAYLDTLARYEVQSVLSGCKRSLPDGGAGCVMVMADFLPAQPGQEGLLIYRDGSFGVDQLAFQAGEGGPQRVRMFWQSGALPVTDDGIALIRALQTTVPTLVPAPINMLPLPEGNGIFLLP
jgi:hypothetical protein